MWQLAKVTAKSESQIGKYLWVVSEKPEPVTRVSIPTGNMRNGPAYRINSSGEQAYVGAHLVELLPIFAEKVREVSFFEWLDMTNEEIQALGE